MDFEKVVTVCEVRANSNDSQVIEKEEKNMLIYQSHCDNIFRMRTNVSERKTKQGLFISRVIDNII